MTRLLPLLFASVVALPLAAQAPAPVPQMPPSDRAAAPPAPADVPSVTSRLEKPAREFVTNFNSGRFDEAVKDFNDTMKIEVQPGTLKMMKARADAEVGTFRSIKDARQELKNGIMTIEFLVAYEKSDVAFGVVFDRYNRIGSIYFNPIVEEKVDPGLERVARDFLASVNSGRFDTAGKHFDIHMKDDLPPAKLASLARQLRQSFGGFRAVKEVHQKSDPKQAIIDLIVDYEKSLVKMSVVFHAKRELISGVFITPLKTPPATRQ